VILPVSAIELTAVFLYHAGVVKMKKIFIPFLVLACASFSCQKKESSLFTVAVCQVNAAPTLNAVKQGFVDTLNSHGFRDGENIRLLIKNAKGDIPEMQRIAQQLIEDHVNMIVPLSTPSLQAVLHATNRIPIVFGSVANPYLAGAGISALDHLPHVTGVSSRGPIKESLEFIRELFPSARRIGTLWTPSEVNSEYYLSLAREAAGQLGMEIVSVQVANTSQVLLAAMVLINKKIDVIYQISDNTINASFEAVGQVAAENTIPLFGGFLLSTQYGACAALGWDFYDMGCRTAELAMRIKEGENPGSIPIEYMEEVKLHLNLEYAELHLNRAHRIIDSRDGGS
jgi:putative ABC transport system substrate-binding protein